MKFPSQSLTERKAIPNFIFSAALLGILRVVRSWNQTGQKHAGEPDIAKGLLPTHNLVLWTLVLMTYVDVTQRMAFRILPGAPRRIAVSCSIALCLAAVGFKVSLTKADAPELLLGLQAFVLRPMDESSLVAQARAVFIGIALLACLTCGPYAFKRSKGIARDKGSRMHLDTVITKAELCDQDCCGLSMIS